MTQATIGVAVSKDSLDACCLSDGAKRRFGNDKAGHAALVAARFNLDLKSKFGHLSAAGKPAKAAITAIMRKLVILANALLKKGQNRQDKTACA